MRIRASPRRSPTRRRRCCTRRTCTTTRSRRRPPARLSALSGLSRAFFCNSGTEANEACLKFARRYWHTQGAKDRIGFVAIEQAFAGRTMGALSVTYDEHYRTPFEPLLGPVTFVDPDSPDALYAAVNDRDGRHHRRADSR